MSTKLTPADTTPRFPTAEKQFSQPMGLNQGTTESKKTLSSSEKSVVIPKDEPSPLAKKVSNYTYNTCIGPFRVKNNGSYAKDLKNLDNIFCYLDEPDLKSSESIGATVAIFNSKMGKRLSRLWNFIFGDHRWYNEKCAVKLVKHFADGMDEGKKTEVLRQKILNIYDRLSTIRKGEGSYVEGIDRSKLEDHSWLTLDNLIKLYNNAPEMPALKKVVQTIGIIALFAGKIWLNNKIQQKYGESKAPLINVKWTDLAAGLSNAMLKDIASA